jgi:hypothetical protein
MAILSARSNGSSGMESSSTSFRTTNPKEFRTPIYYDTTS